MNTIKYVDSVALTVYIHLHGTVCSSGNESHPLSLRSKLMHRLYVEFWCHHVHRHTQYQKAFEFHLLHVKLSTFLKFTKLILTLHLQFIDNKYEVKAEVTVSCNDSCHGPIRIHHGNRSSLQASSLY